MTTPSSPPKIRPAWLVILAAGTIVAMAMGLRQVMGLYLKPVTQELGIGREPFSNAMAWANLIWGAGSIIAGGMIDKYGAGRVVVVCALSTIAGLISMMLATSPWYLYLSGVLTGIGVAGTGVSALVGAVGRAVPPEKRLAAIASMGMAAGIGQLIAFPLTHILIEYWGWKSSLAILAAIGLVMLPMALPIAGKPAPAADSTKSQSLMEAVREAATYPSYWLLTAGFFVCGFHLAFYGVHLPAFVSDKGLPASVGVRALMAVGIANIAGTYLSGQSATPLANRAGFTAVRVLRAIVVFAVAGFFLLRGEQFTPTDIFLCAAFLVIAAILSFVTVARSGVTVERHLGLSFIYLMRCVPFLALLFLPLTPVTVIMISAILGLLWLSTVPLTSSLVGLFFGTQWMSMLYGFVFFSHQLGSFAGLWLAGVSYDATKSYDVMWWVSIALGVFAALIHLPIREQPAPRLRVAAVPAE